MYLWFFTISVLIIQNKTKNVLQICHTIIIQYFKNQNNTSCQIIITFIMQLTKTPCNTCHKWDERGSGLSSNNTDLVLVFTKGWDWKESLKESCWTNQSACQSQTTPHPHPLNHPNPLTHPKKKKTHTHPPTFHSLCLSRQSLWTEPVGTVTSFSSSVEPAVVVLLPLCGADTSCGRWGMRSPAPPLKVCTQRWENTISIPLGKLCF